LVDTSAVKRPTLVRNFFYKKDSILESFNLSAAEMSEVEAVSLKLKKYSLFELEKLTRTTTNAGVQHVLLSRPDLVLDVLNSRNLNAKVIPPFLKRMQNFKTAPLPFNGPRAIYYLVSNKLVVADVGLFKQVWSTAEMMRVSQHTTKTIASDDYLLYATLSEHSKAKVNAMNVETLLFIFTYLNKHEDDLISSFKDLRSQILETRGKEIRAWVKVNIPDCEGLPLSWVYKVFDLYV
jgi:hypothetical protein